MMAGHVDAAAAGLRLESVQSGSALDRLGVRAGDRLLAIDGLVPRDVIDVQLELPAARQVVIKREGGQRIEITQTHEGGQRIELTSARAVADAEEHAVAGAEEHGAPGAEEPDEGSQVAKHGRIRPAREGVRPARPGVPLADGALDAGSIRLQEPVPGGIRECNNHCEFCFIRGLPTGLRPSLYVFDDDYRYSFLWGNFLTLTNLDKADWARIAYQRLSPLNVSVHATDLDVRRKMLGNRHAPPILRKLERLARAGIEVNTQVVLCAGLNDGPVLDQTIGELADLNPSVRCLSVVPVGLTRYSRVKNIRRPTQAEAALAVEQCERWQASLRRKLGVGFVYASDELYLLAGRQDVPPASAYDGYPMLANGVGLLRSMLDEWRQRLGRIANRTRDTAGGATPPASSRTQAAAHATTRASTTRETSVAVKPGPPAAASQMVWLTGRLAAPALQRMADDWLAYADWKPGVVIVENAFFGSEVTVSGLLTGADLIQALRGLAPDVEDIVLPRGPFGFDGRTTLDGVSIEEVGAAHPGRVHLASSPGELLEILLGPH